ncbi:cytosine/adenosine deaminase-related metal-dependent hydrolase [Haloactinopolyspora alba]|uniref:Cytosine/adenosine deaminase-related metal-dependent hydrolase n=1 Tax=Haloactinopolyspora alba TaxID=648780 RepID=A0A2P8E503_9ACTN|nr:amidohydrolase family protein [Haloactinopolyspora alba]PSL04542.1 cytosine/adenosine deaminase-related metal-dependent hydrolase [Haloactinopolyspora alba]
MPTDRFLIRNGVVIDTEPMPHVRPGAEVLVENGQIAAVGPKLPDGGATVVDATDRIVLPGFVDTHRHTCQTVLRSIAVETDLANYLDLAVRRLAPAFTPDDVGAANLVGALECLDSGITTLQDFSHVQYTPEHTEAAVTALRSAGIRSVFGYAFPVFDADARSPEGVRRARRDLLADDTDLVTLALAPNGPSFGSMELAAEDWRLARELGVRLTTHIDSNETVPRPVAALREHGLLDGDTLYVHGNTLADDELRLIAESGGAMSIAPAVEARMGHGPAVVGRLRAAGVTTGLGVDVVTTVAGDMFSLMRATLLSGHDAGHTDLSAAEVLRMATQDGADAVGLGDRVGSLRSGKQADLVLLRADDVNLAGGLHDPVGAVVTAAHPGNVDTVLVAGRPVKRDGRVTGADLAKAVDAATRSAESLAVRASAR